MRKEAEYGRVFTFPVTHVVPHSRIVAKKNQNFLIQDIQQSSIEMIVHSYRHDRYQPTLPTATL
jgi:hypothetical protein